MDTQLIEKPVIQRTVILKFQRTERIGYLLNRIFQAVSPVVHWIHAPLISLAVMVGMQNAVHNRVTHINVGMGHFNFSAQYARTVREFARAHALEQVQVFFSRAVAERAVDTGFGERAAITADFL